MTADLEDSHGEGVAEDGCGRGTDLCPTVPRVGEQEAVTGYEAKLDKGEGDGVFELVHDLLSSVGGESGGGVPECAEDDEPEHDEGGLGVGG